MVVQAAHDRSEESAHPHRADTEYGDGSPGPGTKGVHDRSRAGPDAAPQGAEDFEGNVLSHLHDVSFAGQRKIGERRLAEKGPIDDLSHPFARSWSRPAGRR